MVSLVKRYTPPTCSLEIVGKVSPLSIYLQKPNLKELYFQLHFDDPRFVAEKKITVTGDRYLLDSLCNIVREYVQNFLTQPTITSNVTKLPTSSQQPYLHSQGVTNHKLHLGNLNRQSSPQSILLSVVQLFDLAHALDEYSQEIASLPEFYRGQSKKAIPLFATAGIILAVGLTVGVKLSHQSPTPSPTESVAKISTPEIMPTSPKKSLPEVIPPHPSTNQPVTPAILPLTLQKREKLSPPSPVTPPPSPKLTQPSVTSTQSSKVKPSQTELVIIPQPKPQPTQAKQPETPTLIINPQPPQTEKKPPVLVLKSPSEVPTFQDNSQTNLSSPELSSPETNFPSDLSLNSPNTEIIIPEKIEEEKPPENLLKPSLDETASLFDYTPQVAEVRNYFQEKWQPPTDLQQTLQYRLVINKNGYLQTVIPLGYNAEFYLQQVNFPPSSQSFVSPFSQSETQIIRLVLQPDGNILTLLDT